MSLIYPFAKTPERMASLVAGSSEPPGCGLSRGAPGRPPHHLGMGASLRPALPEMPWTLGRSRGQLGPQEPIATHTHGLRTEHPLVAASGNVASTPDHSPTLPAFPRQYLTTCPHGSRPQEGVAGGPEEGQAQFLRSSASHELLVPGSQPTGPRGNTRR